MTSLFFNPYVVVAQTPLLVIPSGAKFNLQAANVSTGALSSWDTFTNTLTTGTKPVCNTGGGIGGGKFVSFNGSSTFMYNQTTLSCTTGLTIGMLIRFPGTVSAWERVMQGALVASPSIDFFAINRVSNEGRLTFHILSGQGNDYESPADNFLQDTWYVWTYRFTNTNTNTRITRLTTGVSPVTTTLLNTNSTGTSIGAIGNTTYCLGANNFGSASTTAIPVSGNYAKMDIGGFIMYERSLTDIELSDLTNYLTSGQCC